MILAGNETMTPDLSGSIAAIGRYAPVIFQAMARSHERFIYPSRRELTFEIRLRNKTIEAAQALHRSRAAFATFYYSACNEAYWSLTGEGGFDLKPGRPAAEAIRDIFENGEAYAFECATAMMIVFYKALIDCLPEERFNSIFSHLYLWDWQNHPFFSLKNASRVGTGIPGDVRYFKNPDVNPQTPQWQGENAVDLSGGLYYGHGIGIMTADRIIEELNQYRRQSADTSAYLMPGATRPDYLSLAAFDAGTPSDGIRIAAGSSVYTFSSFA
ncbi:protein-glutamine gamma-glutamyltransferase [Sporolactobacillus sp. THM7-7]|nr:protein-glutamine gamma-glutamyltransferase [Sporolactobacillus sp. THM7-7]